MKRIFSILAIACIAMLFASCHKDGVYNPSKKISKIYYTSSSGNKSLKQVWTWNKKTLDKIDYYSSGSIDDTYNFTYEKNRLVRMDNYLEKLHIDYKYDGSKLKEANYYYGNSLVETYTFTYQNGKIAIINGTYFGDKSGNNNQVNALEFILPEGIAQQVEETHQKRMANGSKGNLIETYTLTWDKGNVTKLVCTSNSDGELYECTYEFQYDNKKNPFYGAFMNFFVEEDITNGLYSSNNYTQFTLRDSEGFYGITNYQYTYDGNYPTSRRYMGEGYSTLTEFEYIK